MRSIAFEVPGDVRGWGRAGLSHGRHFTDAKTTSYEAKIATMAKLALGGAPMLEGPLAITLTAWKPVPASWSKKKQAEALGRYCVTKPDLDNVIKGLLDGLNGVLYKDDVQVARLVAEKRYGASAKLVVVVSEAEDIF